MNLRAMNSNLVSLPINDAQVRRAADLKEAATKLVSSALIVPAMGSWHESPLRPSSGPFAPGIAEKRFAPLLVQELADRAAGSMQQTLIADITKRMSRFQPGGIVA